MFSKELYINRYKFDDGRYKRYLDVQEDDLTFLELSKIDELLQFFPHASHRDWVKPFLELDINNIPNNLLRVMANAYDNHGNTMLGIAAELGQEQALQKLIDMGANLDTPDHNMKKLPLHWAICNKLSYKDKDSYEAVKVVTCLLKNGANPNKITYEGLSPRVYAEKRGYTAAAKLIEVYERSKNFNFFKDSVIGNKKVDVENIQFQF